MIFMAPERLDTWAARFREQLQKSNSFIHTIVIDEAHCIDTVRKQKICFFFVLVVVFFFFHFQIKKLSISKQTCSTDIVAAARATNCSNCSVIIESIFPSGKLLKKYFFFSFSKIVQK